MHIILLVILIGLIGGVAVGFQAPLANLISLRLGMFESVFIIHLGGAIAGLAPLIYFGGGNITAWQTVPWYALAAGSLGVVVIGAISYTIPHIGAAPTIVLVVVGQLVVGIYLDHFGLLGMAVRPLDIGRGLGIVVVLMGVWLLVR
jgi:transporter family-2 protein